MIYFRAGVPVIELSTIDDNVRASLEIDKFDDTIVNECRMTIREFWLSKHGIYLFLCFWTSILIIGKISPPVFSFEFLFI